MDSDELDSANASLSWLDETAFNAECLPLESLDFAIFSGDVVPRDGIQRPILIGGDGPGHVHRVHHGRSPCTSPMFTKQSFNPPCQWPKGWGTFCYHRSTFCYQNTRILPYSARILHISQN